MPETISKMKRKVEDTSTDQAPKKLKKTNFKTKRKTEDANTDEKPKKLKKAVQNSANKINNDTINKTSGTPNKNNKSDRKRKIKFEKPLGTKRPKTEQNKSMKNKENFKKQSDQSATDKPNWAELRKTNKELREKRKAKKLTDLYDISIQAKQLSERLRRSDCSFEERRTLTQKIHKLLETHYANIILTHDMSRIIQWVLKYSDEKIQQAILNELKPQFIQILESKYARNCILTIIRNGSEQLKKDLVTLCYGHVVKLMSNTLCAPIVETLYSSHASDAEKAYYKQEFYGEMYKNAKDKNIKTLSDVFKNAEGMKTATLSAVKGHLSKILNKNLIKSTLIQTLLYEFLTNCTEADRSEIIVSLRDSVFELTETKIGTKVAILCVWHGTNKDRKAIMKALKGHVTAIAMSEDGYMLLLALMDSADDTVVLKKIILSEIQNEVTEIALNEYGKHVILYLVARRDPHYFPPSTVEYLKQGDNNATSKKPADIREKELREGIVDTLLEKITGETSIWLSTGSMSMITLAILKVATGENLKSAFKAIAVFLMSSNSKIKCEDVEYKPVEHPAVHLMLKKLIQYDKEFQKKEETTFGEILINNVTTPVLQEWIKTNRGCFLLVFLMENEVQSAVDNLSSKLQPILKDLKSKNYPGASILLKKLK